ncbi:MAG: helix-turn-helix transcriptional regulator [Bryobacterales bacterium]|nr:helix-turn-helix transcriptional regulator [Bryobacterales bacterium]
MRNSVRELRMARGWTQEELGIKVGVSRQAIIAIESGKYDPSLPLAIKLARALRKPVEGIFILEDASSKP